MTDVAIVDIEDDMYAGVSTVFDLTLRGESSIKSSGEIYLKPNAVDFKPFAFTDPELVAAVIDYFYDSGANVVYLMENSTQALVTRMVFEFTGYRDICRRKGAIPLYLDEQPTQSVKLPNFREPIDFPDLIVDKFIRNPDAHTYISLPKLKTHSMTTVTLGIKNQMAFPSHSDRGHHHNYNLHRRLADLFSVVRPDFTLIDGTNAVFNGHLPLETFQNESLDPLGILIGGVDTLAVDTVGAKVLGYNIEQVPHLTLVQEDGNGIGNLEEINILGNLKRFSRVYPYEIMDMIPEDVKIVRGKEMVCKEGCEMNTLMCVQILYYDFGGKGGFTIVMGKGFDSEEINGITGRVLLAGDCAIEETKKVLEEKLGAQNVFTSDTCNRLATTISALSKLMGVNALSLVPSKITAIKSLILSKLHGSKALTPALR